MTRQPQRPTCRSGSTISPAVVELAERLDSSHTALTCEHRVHPSDDCSPAARLGSLSSLGRCKRATPPRRTEVERRVASLRRIAERLRAVGR